MATSKKREQPRVNKEHKTKKTQAKKKTAVRKKKATKKAPVELAPAVGQFVTKVAFAKWNGVSPRMVTNYEDQGLPSVKSGGGRGGNKIDSALGQRWLEKRYLEKERPAGGKLTLEKERLRLTTEQADEKAIKNATDRGGLIAADDVDDLFMGACASLAATLSGLPGRLANELARESSPAAVRDKIKREITRARSEFADYLRQPQEYRGDKT